MALPPSCHCNPCRNTGASATEGQGHQAKPFRDYAERGEPHHFPANWTLCVDSLLDRLFIKAPSAAITRKVHWHADSIDVTENDLLPAVSTDIHRFDDGHLSKFHSCRFQTLMLDRR